MGTIVAWVRQKACFRTLPAKQTGGGRPQFWSKAGVVVSRDQLTLRFSADSFPRFDVTS